MLAVLLEHGELCVADVAAAALSPQPTVTHALRRLEKRGLVTRTLGTHDKRQRFTSISPTGKKLATALIREAKRLEAEALADAGDLSDLVEQLRRLTATVESHAHKQTTAPRSEVERAG